METQLQWHSSSLSSRSFSGGAGQAVIVRLRVSYDGRGFWGSQRQLGQRSVQGELERAVEAVFGRSLPVYLAGRTDRGVHAAGQVASFAPGRLRIAESKIVPALNDHLDRDLAVLESSLAPVGFHARYSAIWREYRYRVWAGVRQPLAEGFALQLRDRLDVKSMNEASRVLVGEHDFASFASGGEGVPWSQRGAKSRGSHRTVLHCSVEQIDAYWGATARDGELVEIRVVADGFLPRMVRGVAGLLVEVGRGTVPIADIRTILEARDRRKSAKNAPPDGLVLWAIGYEPFTERADSKNH